MNDELITECLNILRILHAARTTIAPSSRLGQLLIKGNVERAILEIEGLQEAPLQTLDIHTAEVVTTRDKVR
jgi:hypothetical protein